MLSSPKSLEYHPYCWWLNLLSTRILGLQSHFQGISPSHEHRWWSSLLLMLDSKHIFSFDYPAVRRERFGARVFIFPIQIPYSMGSQLELRIEFPNHQIENWWISPSELSLWDHSMSKHMSAKWWISQKTNRDWTWFHQRYGYSMPSVPLSWVKNQDSPTELYIYIHIYIYCDSPQYTLC